MKANERLAEIRERLDTERAETIARRPTDYPHPMDTWWEADLKWCLTHIAELEKLLEKALGSAKHLILQLTEPSMQANSDDMEWTARHLAATLQEEG